MGLLESERGFGAGVRGLRSGFFAQDFKIQFGRIEIFFDLEFINVECLGSNRMMVG